MTAPDCLRPNTVRSDPKDIGQLDHDLADRVWTMMQYAPHKALIPVSLYRDPGRQWDLRHERCPGHECNMKACRGVPTTATPYGSNHPKRLAADLGGRDLLWAYHNAARFGLCCPVKGENWHFQKGGKPQVQIIPYPGHRWDAPAPPVVKPEPNAGRTWDTFSGAGTTDAAIYAKGKGYDNEVSQVQYLIGHTITGRYTPADADAVAKLKTLANWVDPDEPKHNRTSGVTPAFRQALEGLHNAGNR